MGKVKISKQEAEAVVKLVETAFEMVIKHMDTIFELILKCSSEIDIIDENDTIGKLCNLYQEVYGDEDVCNDAA